MQYYWKLHKHTSIHCSFSWLRIIGVWYSVCWSIIADQKIDCCLKGNYWLVFYFKNIYFLWNYILLIFLSSYQRMKTYSNILSTFTDQGNIFTRQWSRLTWSEVFQIDFSTPEESIGKKKQTVSDSLLFYTYNTHTTWGTLPGDHAVSMSWLNQAKHVLPF